MKIISQADAKAAGLKFYFTGKPCKRGHVAERRVSKGECLECARAYIAAYKARPEVRARDAVNANKPERKAKKAAADAARYARPEEKARIAARNATPEGQAQKRENWHWYKYGEPFSARVARYERQQCCDDLSGEEARLEELHQDHDHATGKMRGLISGAYNSALGRLGFNDSPVRCTQAAAYLVRHAANDPQHPLLADQQMLLDIKAEADRLSAMVAQLICQTPTNDNATAPTPKSSPTAGPTKPSLYIVPKEKPHTVLSETTQLQNSNGPSRKSA